MKSKLVVIAISAVAVVGGGVSYWYSGRPAPIEYREIKIERGSIARTILATGTVQPENRVEIKPPVPGRVEEVLVKEGQVVKKGQLLALMSSTERAGLLDAARSKGIEEVKRWKEMYNATPVLAPINGTVIVRNVESGQTFASTDSILVMSDRLTVKAQVDETDIAQVKLHQKAIMVLDAYAEDKIPATVDQIAFEAKTVSNVTTYIVDVLPDTTPDYMRSGMTANVTFLVNTKDGILTVRNEALRYDEAGHTKLLLKDASGKPREVAVTLGITDGKKSEIVDGAVTESDVVLIAKAVKTKADSTSNPLNVMGGGRGGRPSSGSHK